VFEAFDLPFAQRGLIEVLALAVGAGLAGTWIVLRGLAFFAHAVGTAAFPGLVLADGLGFAPMLGAFGVAVLFAFALARLSSHRRTGYDSLTALVLVGALAVGVVLASDVFGSGAGIDSLLFGSLLLVGTSDIVLAAAVSAVVLAATLVLGRRWLAIGFDSESASALGLRAGGYDLALLGLVAVSAVAVLSMVGALLAGALLVVPAATTRLWFDRLGAWQLATVGLAGVEGVAGLWLSLETDAPPGATIAVLAGGVFVLAALARAIRPRPAPALAAVAVLGALAFAGCGDDDGGSGDRLGVVATTTQIADFTREVGGEGVEVAQILQPNTDAHDYEPRPSDVRATASAKLVFVNGGDVDQWMPDVVEQSGGDPKVVELGDRVPVKVAGEEHEEEGGHAEEEGAEHAEEIDPHWWHDPVNAQAAVEQIRDALVAADPGRKAEFERNAAAYLDRLRALNAGIARCFEAVPPAQRKLVTDHDAFNYFVKRYGIEYVGAVIPSQTTQAQPSAGDVSALVRLIRREGVQAVFPEESVSPKLAESIARQTGATSDYTLYGDALGPKGSRGDTYLGMEQANADAMVRGFTGGRERCRIAGVS
jgi:ABC-type Zn uptake system ZnuABC Zn-binding protein ZnuA/ABC-type Mn2+/Zn2+ transport system permease subunit